MLLLSPLLLLLSLLPACLALSPSSPSLESSLLPHSKTGRPLPRTIHGSLPAHRRRMDLYQERSRYTEVLAKRNISDSSPPVEQEVEFGGRAEVKKLRRRGSCKAKASSSSAVAFKPSSTNKAASASSTVKVQAHVIPTKATTSVAVPSSFVQPRPSSSSSAKASVIASPSPKPSSASIPSLSSKVAAATIASAPASTSTESYRSSPLFTTKRTKGDLTYYAQGQTSCGSVYDDTTYTAAVSKLLYDSWPGATVNTNRNPICGPFVPGRLSLDGSVLVAAAESVLVGGDNLLNCIAGVMCHKPLTATLTYEGKSVQVEIVDRCEGCAVEDIDVTPTVFEALTGNLGIGRVKGSSGKFSWSFDQ